MQKLFFISDALIFNKDTVDSQTLGDQDPSFTRACVVLRARTGCCAQDILDEVQNVEDDIERYGLLPVPGIISRRVLTMTLTEDVDLVVALTYQGFVDIAEGFKSMSCFSGSTKKERYESLARDLEKGPY